VIQLSTQFKKLPELGNEPGIFLILHYFLTALLLSHSGYSLQQQAMYFKSCTKRALRKACGKSLATFAHSRADVMMLLIFLPKILAFFAQTTASF
jgi:hypothetical protein